MKKKLLIISIIIITLISLSIINIIVNIRNTPNLEKYASSEKTDAIYELINQTSEGKLQLLVIIENPEGIEYINYFNDTIYPNGKEKVAIDFEAEKSSQYEFKIKSTNKAEETLILDTNRIDNLVVNDPTDPIYPILKNTGVEVKRYITIENTEDLQTYYSLDNGNTWIEHNKEEIEITEDIKLKVKSPVNNEINYMYSKDIKLNLASDALPKMSYDKNSETETVILYTPLKLYLSQEVIGKEIKVDWYNNFNENHYHLLYLSIKDENGNELMNVQATVQVYGRREERKITIPENAAYIEFYSNSSHLWPNCTNVYEIGLNDN